ncbi:MULTISPECIES: helix-turn-helix domain-containing protein [unclassified Nocardioides]|uniref:helix-turn-helix domain-containing protein n=1 Tax=unclassified Nocardioides TaxID=2615069 RepID=UPI0009E9E767
MSEYLTVQEAADLLRCHRATVRRQIDAGQLPAIRLGRCFRIRRSDVDALRQIPNKEPSTPVQG